MTTAITRWDPLFLGLCPRCSAVLHLSELKIAGQAAVVCPNDYSVSRVKKLADAGKLKPCGFLWYAPWSRTVIERRRRTCAT